MPHGGSYWEENGVVEPTREDYVYHVEFNHIYQYGQGILNDMGAVHSGKAHECLCMLINLQSLLVNHFYRSQCIIMRLK